MLGFYCNDCFFENTQTIKSTYKTKLKNVLLVYSQQVTDLLSTKKGRSLKTPAFF